ncbi:hypothetical protein [Cellulomonas sp. S1-8]|uniref:hypothetical protein n=1 Tax=Cellulomonas sp. S1-8 TaxID=2904790 RepID=UPI002242D1DC|nr:hypothetical protein [Cellulomonas sp. S1-8]UZN02525.1 hypothetical protein OKX07_15905 [Cellulomonas sp. S1-8]
MPTTADGAPVDHEVSLGDGWVSFPVERAAAHVATRCRSARVVATYEATVLITYKWALGAHIKTYTCTKWRSTIT